MPINHATLRLVLTDLGFPSVNDCEPTTRWEYDSVVSDAWSACDQTDEDMRAINAAYGLIARAFNA